MRCKAIVLPHSSPAPLCPQSPTTTTGVGRVLPRTSLGVPIPTSKCVLERLFALSFLPKRTTSSLYMVNTSSQGCCCCCDLPWVLLPICFQCDSSNGGVLFFLSLAQLVQGHRPAPFKNVSPRSPLPKKIPYKSPCTGQHIITRLLLLRKPICFQCDFWSWG